MLISFCGFDSCSNIVQSFSAEIIIIINRNFFLFLTALYTLLTLEEDFGKKSKRRVKL